MIKKNAKGEIRPDWSAILTAVVLIVTVVAMHYTAIGELKIKDTEIDGKINVLEMEVRLGMEDVSESLDDIKGLIERVDNKIERLRESGGP